MSYSHEKEPSLTRLEVFPRERRYRKGATQKLIVHVHYDNAMVRDVTALAGFYSNDKQIATVTEDGKITVDQLNGQAVIVARFMGMVGDSQVIVPSDRLLSDESYQSLRVENFIDERAWAHFRQLGLLPSEPCSDAEFLRRASLDSLGILPSAEEAKQFLADPDPWPALRIRPGVTDIHGDVQHDADGGWSLRFFGQADDRSDAPTTGLAAHEGLRPGAYVSVNEPEGEARAFRVVGVEAG